jgi:hypothetical protein
MESRKSFVRTFFKNNSYTDETNAVESANEAIKAATGMKMAPQMVQSIFRENKPTPAVTQAKKPETKPVAVQEPARAVYVPAPEPSRVKELESVIAQLRIENDGLKLALAAKISAMPDSRINIIDVGNNIDDDELKVVVDSYSRRC